MIILPHPISQFLFMSFHPGPPMNCTGHFAARAGLEVGINGGFLVNRCMLASDGVYLSGEVANVRMSVGRGIYTGVDHAYHTGIVAGRNMAGVFDTYDHIPIYEASAKESDIHLTFVGHCSSAFETHGFWWKLGGQTSTSTSSSPSTATSTSALTSSSSSAAKKNANNSGQGLFDPVSSSLQNSRGPIQQTIGERITTDFFEFFGYKPILPKVSQSKILSFTPMGKLNVIKMTEENMANNLSKNKSQPPLGLGILFYVDNDIVVGLLISGTPLSQQGKNPKKKNDNGNDDGSGMCQKKNCNCKIKCDSKNLKKEGSKIDENNDENLDILSYSETIHERARSFIGKPLSTVVAAIEVEIPEDGMAGTGVTDFRSGRLIRLQNLSEIAAYILAPSVLPAAAAVTISDSRITTTIKPEYKKIASQLPKPNYRFSPPSRTITNAYASNVQTETLSLAPTIMQENVFSVGGDLTGTRADKLAAAYASGLRYGIEGPGKV